MIEETIVKDENSLTADISKTNSRIWEVDFIRGICILLMVMDHYFWEMGYFVYNFFGMSSSVDPIAPSWLLNLIRDARWYYELDFRIALRYLILFLFFFISGISMNFSKNNTKRGLQILGCGLIITMLTSIGCLSDILTFPDHFIPFGVLSCFGVCILLVEGIKKLTLKLSKNNINVWIVVSFLIFIISTFIEIFYLVNKTNVTFGFSSVFNALMQFLGCIIGFTKFGADYFPIFPYLGIIALGNLMGLLIYKDKKSLFKRESRVLKPFTFVGKHTMYLYLFHIPVIVLIISIIFLCAGLRFTI